MAAKRMAFANFFGSKQKTFRPRKRGIFEGTIKFKLHKQANASLNSGIDLQEVVKLPHGEDRNDWIAVHVVDFFNRINMLYGTLCEYCTEQTCPTMSGGPKYDYYWCDGINYKKPTALPAPKYISNLMEWVEEQINDENIFPVKVGVPFPKNFTPTVKKILTRLFRVFVHVYIHHFDKLLALEAEAHVNTCFKHFYYFIKEFELVEKKELEPLREMTERMCHC
ncbi:MOB kinase activator 3B-like [Mizuhopecten yessoensis]|uniref:MOB kinase activator 3B n=1 Tax=Mizuhopecten yessoensis TaxID=6573 RepID=A0A210QDJ2_MIZYE|nr:MOB kinase activator 3B-like [Mizuhopecten yessoensis]OWF46758.1 MOB kinase activator 3B [Mizuhopecten yessoensis]